MLEMLLFLENRGLQYITVHILWKEESRKMMRVMLYRKRLVCAVEARMDISPDQAGYTMYINIPGALMLDCIV
jgi:hypothetical protein